MTIINSKLNITKKPQGQNEEREGGAHKNKKKEKSVLINID